MAETDQVPPDAAADAQSVDDFIAEENARDRGVAAESSPDPAAPSSAPEGTLAATPAADETTERNTDGTFKKRNRRDDPQEAVKSAIAKQREAERRAEAAEARLRDETSRQTLQRPAQQEQRPPTPSEWARYKAMPEAPKLEAFDAFEDWNIAMGIFVADTRHDEREAQRRQQSERQQQEHEHRTRDQSWFTRLSEARQKDPSFDQRINPDTPMSEPMKHLVKDSPVGIELLVWLSDHPDDAQRLSTLHPALVMREMGKLEARLEAATTSGPARSVNVSQAKPPIKPLGTSPPTTDPYAITEDLSVEEHIRRMNAIERRERAGR